MSSTSAKLDRAMETLRLKGHKVPDNGAIVNVNGSIMISVDDTYKSFNEIYTLAGMEREPE